VGVKAEARSWELEATKLLEEKEKEKNAPKPIKYGLFVT
jgi:hypothetical protein